MNTTLKGAVLALAIIAVTFQAGCRTERTQGQRRQAQAIDTVFESEMIRLASLPEDEVSVEDYAHMVELYRWLTKAALRSGSGEPRGVQDAEDDLLELAGEARALQAYAEWSPESQRNFDNSFWKNRLAKWKQWRGPGYDMTQSSAKDED